jgi:hypothetical protein
MDRRPTTQDISWFLDLNRNGQLNLDPPYQRRSVWSPRDRRFFLDTIFRGYACPAIFLHKRLEDGGGSVYEVVDGKQRLQTILTFVDNKIALAADFGDVALNGKKWRDLPSEKQRRFWDYVLPVEFIKTVEGTVVNEVFERLNRNSRKLDRQELRHARNEGWFITFVEKEPDEDDFWKLYKISTTATSRRMGDVQFISELLLLLLRKQIRGFDQDELDDAYSLYDVPEETTPDFDRASVSQRFGQIKQYLRAMDDRNGCIRTYASGSRVHLFSLWAWVALNEVGALPVPAQAADHYVELMAAVEALKDSDLDALIAGQGSATDLERTAFEYARNARGATTEPAQRVARHAALVAALTPKAP